MKKVTITFEVDGQHERLPVVVRVLGHEISNNLPLRGVACEHENRRAGSRNDCSETVRAQHLNESIRLGHGARTVVLVQLVSRSIQQQFRTLRERSNQ